MALTAVRGLTRSSCNFRASTSALEFRSSISFSSSLILISASSAADSLSRLQKIQTSLCEVLYEYSLPLIHRKGVPLAPVLTSTGLSLLPSPGRVTNCDYPAGYSSFSSQPKAYPSL